ncbi:hypothetical protein [Brevibacterium moorei]|uniref:hypothetical protein n=1 Tax=Brevibacterium moorei TaxID=2968457 RepID=UPI00211C6C9D|nr:hypothetical protein [Brevibacterium sp. 68QC2CO]MCQ9384655.1 hypothetical protein [Brevibacterium sp. 68QC2CO]
MADPTAYDLVQDDRLTDLETLVTPQPKPPAGTEYSFPVVGQDITDAEYRQMMMAQGNGVLDQGGQPYWLRNLDNATDTAQITVSKTAEDAKAVIGGFFHRLTADKTISLPPVTKATTYYVCLTYDPQQATNPAGPITLQVYAGTPPTTQGKIHITLWRVPRNPNQLLAATTPQRVRPKIAPTITVDHFVDLPDPSTVLWGTRASVTNEPPEREYRAWGSSEETGAPETWKRVGGTWHERADTASYKWPGHGHRAAYKTENGRVYLRGRVTRADATTFNPNVDGGDGFNVLQLPDDMAPAAEERFIVTGGFSQATVPFGALHVKADGSCRLFVSNNIMTWVDLAGISFDHKSSES